MSNTNNGNVTFKHVRTITDDDDGTMTFVFEMTNWAKPGVISVTVDELGRASIDSSDDSRFLSEEEKADLKLFAEKAIEVIE